MAKIVLMQGLPASGKSTRAKEIVSQGSCYRINRDLLRTMLHFDKWSGTNEGVTLGVARSIADALLTQGHSVVIDDTNLNPRVIQGWVDLAKKHDAKVQYEKMNTLIEECIARDAVREKRVGEHTIYNTALQYGMIEKPEKAFVICDLDGTVFNIEHRLKYARGKEKNWDTFFSLIRDDEVRQDTVETVNKYRALGHPVVFVSARPERCREDSEYMLEKAFGVRFWQTIIMRRNQDKRDDVEVKQQVFDTYFKEKYPVEVVIDDRPKVIRMWRSNGLEVIDVGSGEEF